MKTLKIVLLFIICFLSENSRSQTNSWGNASKAVRCSQARDSYQAKDCNRVGATNLECSSFKTAVRENCSKADYDQLTKSYYGGSAASPKTIVESEKDKDKDKDKDNNDENRTLTTKEKREIQLQKRENTVCEPENKDGSKNANYNLSNCNKVQRELEKLREQDSDCDEIAKDLRSSERKFEGRCSGSCKTDVERCATGSVSREPIGNMGSAVIGMGSTSSCKLTAFRNNKDIEKQQDKNKTDLEKAEDKLKDVEEKISDNERQTNQDMARVQGEIQESMDQMDRAEGDVEKALIEQADEAGSQRAKILEQLARTRETIRKMVTTQVTKVKNAFAVNQKSFVSECDTNAKKQAREYGAAIKKTSKRDGVVVKSMSQLLANGKYKGNSEEEKAYYLLMDECTKDHANNTKLEALQRGFQDQMNDLQDQVEELKIQEASLLEQIQRLETMVDAKKQHMLAQAQKMITSAQNKIQAKTQELKKIQETSYQKAMSLNQQRQSYAMQRMQLVQQQQMLATQASMLNSQGALNGFDGEDFQEALRAYGEKQASASEYLAVCCDGSAKETNPKCKTLKAETSIRRTGEGVTDRKPRGR